MIAPTGSFNSLAILRITGSLPGFRPDSMSLRYCGEISTSRANSDGRHPERSRRFLRASPLTRIGMRVGVIRCKRNALEKIRRKTRRDQANYERGSPPDHTRLRPAVVDYA